jgi:prolyl-tRNA synthetase
MEVMIIVDDLIPNSTNLVAGANDPGYHLLNVNYGRDFQAHMVTDITAAQDGDLCPKCSNPLKAVRGVEVGNIFKLGTRYSDTMGCTYQDKDGKDKPIIMGSYGIGSGRLLASIAEEHHDGFGLIWPITVAPYHVYLIMLSGKKDEEEVSQAANKLYNDMKSNGIEVLFDDRSESPGVKFNDADLIGIPIRITVSARNLENKFVEIKRRDQDKSSKELLPIDNVISTIKKLIKDMRTEVDSNVKMMPYKD